MDVTVNPRIKQEIYAFPGSWNTLVGCIPNFPINSLIRKAKLTTAL